MVALLPNFERNKSLSFDSEKHIYTAEKAVLCSVSTFTHKFINDIFDAERVAKIVAQKEKTTPEEIIAKWNKMRDFGTNMHAKIEDWLKSDNCEPTFSDDAEKLCWSQFKNFWATLPPIKFVAPELRIYDEELEMAGTIDLLVQFADESWAIYDWKFVGQMRVTNPFADNMKYPFDSFLDTNYYTYTLQQNLYQFILERKYNISISNTHLVQMHPTMTDYKVYKLQNWQELLTDYFNEIALDKAFSTLTIKEKDSTTCDELVINKNE